MTEQKKEGACGVRSQQRPEEIGRVPRVRTGVHGPKKMGAALRSPLSSDKKIRLRAAQELNSSQQTKWKEVI
jgi:hypothetical protein